MSNIVPVPIDRAQLPQSMLNRRRAGQSMNQNLALGVVDAFPLLSIKGKVFRARISGEETPFIDPHSRTPVPFLDLIIVNGAPNMSKTFYTKGFEEGDLNPPDCWSLDAVRPDPSVANKVSPTCGNCPMNQFGSRTTPAGKQAKACADARRVAVMMPHELGQDNPRIFLMRIPQGSLKNLKGYAQHLERYNIDTNACITRLAFDYNEAFPKLLFNFVAPLDDTSYQLVEELAEGQYVKSMLQAPDFDNTPSTPPIGNTAGPPQGMVQQTGPILATDDPGPVQQVPVQQQAAPVQYPDTLAQRMPQQAAPVQKAKPASGNVRQLPDGKWIDMDTMTYVDPPKAKAPELDPTTIKLPDGRFYNPLSNSFVTGPEKGAGPVSAEPAKAEAKAEPAKQTKPRQTKAKADAAPQQAAQPVQNVQNGQAAETQMAVEDLPEDMEDALQALLPSA